MKAQKIQAELGISMKFHSINARDSILFDIVIDYFNADSNGIHNYINQLFSSLNIQLKRNRIEYDKLRSLLTWDNSKKEYCFVFDTMLIDNMMYGGIVLEKFTNVFSMIKASAVFYGDLIGNNNRKVQENIFNALSEGLNLYNNLNYVNSTQFFVVYFSALSKAQLQSAIDDLKCEPYFIGYMDMSFCNYIKNIISVQIPQQFLIYNDNIIQVSVDGETSDVNYTLFDFDNINKKIINIEEESYLVFLTYKIKRDLFDHDSRDQEVTVNSVIQDTIKLHGYDICIEDDKFEKYLKRERVKSLDMINGNNSIEKSELIKKIQKNINMNYLYDIEYNKYGCLKFTTDIEFYNGLECRIFRIKFAFEIKKSQNLIRLITML